MKKQTELNKKRKEMRKRLFSELPDITEHIASQAKETYKDGALNAKIKRLMALAIGLSAGCTNCQLSQAETAIKLGATKEEILEVIAVVMSMRGTTGVGESLRVIEYLEELGEL